MRALAKTFFLSACAIALLPLRGFCVDPELVPKKQVLPSPISRDITVIGWVNPAAITLPTGATQQLVNDLNDSFGSCTEVTTAWTADIRMDIFSDVDRRYANAWLLQNSPNKEPATFIADLAHAENDGDYRLFSRLKVEVKVNAGQIVAPPKFHTGRAAVGMTPEPCSGFHFNIPTLSAPEPHIKNGEHAITSSGGRVYQLNQGRIGAFGQAVDTTLNAPGTPHGETTPWIWSNIKVDSDGNLVRPLITQIFPTYYLYLSGIRSEIIPQSAPEPFIALDQTSVISDPRIDP